jgi:hypothetical protein
VTQPARDRERVRGRLEPVAEHAVDRGEHRLALGPGEARAQQRAELRERAVEPEPDQRRDPADAAVDEPRHQPTGQRERAQHARRPVGDRAVHVLDDGGHAARRVDEQPARAAQILAVVALGRHRTMYARATW